MMPQFVALMTHRITLHHRQRDWEGNFETDVSTTGIPAFVEYGKKLVTNLKGEEVLATAIIFLRNDAPISPEHPYWLIDQTSPYSRSGMEVISIDPISDPRTGVTHHFEVAVK